ARARNARAPRAAGPPSEKAVHETRKAIKRLRALLRLLRSELGERAYERETATLRQVAHELSGARDAAVMVATLDALAERHPCELARRHGVIALRRRLHAHSDRLSRATLADASARANVLGELHALRWRVAAWTLPKSGGIELVDADLQHLYRQGRERCERVARDKGERTLEMHKWRKRVKDLRYAAEMLERRGEPRSKRESRASTRAHKLAARADELGELLGEDHDLAVLAEHLLAGAHADKHRRERERERDASDRDRDARERTGVMSADGAAGEQREQLWTTPRGTRRALSKAIARRRRKLRKRALREGARLYREKPRRFMRRMR
ncbi:MAG TPA: CHAD domain-containing protein, partial [Solirubrobacteraceae bacterium]|nr:CHAD domain-containing protein [Solirubrobacteraceae bacterium]